MRVTIGGSSGQETGLAGKIVASLFLSAFLAAGLFFTTLVVRGYFHTLRQYTWTRTACTVDAATLADADESGSSEPYGARIEYRYPIGGEHSGRYEKWFSDVSAAQRVLLDHPVGSSVECFVDPRDPASSTLRRGSLLSGLVILFPLLFVLVGGVPMYFLWRPRKAPAATGAGAGSAAPARAAPLTGRAKGSPAGCLLMGGFFGIFLVVGLGIMWWLLGYPLRSVVAARSWIETPCTVLASEVRSHAGDDSTTYSIDILYRYEVNGQELRSNRYDFFVGSSGGAEGKQAVVDRYPVGDACTCWVDPRDPTSAVLDRSFRSSYWSGLFGLPFFLAGAGGLVFLAWRGRQAGRPLRVPVPSTTAPGSGSVTLRPKSGPWKKLLQALFINLFWNGIVGVFVWVLAKEWQKGNHLWVPILIISLFALIGLALLSGIPYAVLALFNPRPILELERGALAPGESLAVRYRFRGFASRLTRLRLAVEGEENVSYTTHSGNTTSFQSASTVFCREEFFDSGGGPVPARGEALLRLPADTMHSLEAPHNRVRWKVKVHGEIPRWPDVEEEFPLAVLPPEDRR